MLVLTRRPTESIIISNNIKITVVSIGPGRVKIGIEAPPNVRIDRQEIHDKIEQSADVLSAVAGGEAAADNQNTMIGHGPDTAEIVFAPPGEKPGAGERSPVPAPAAPVAAPAAAPAPTNKLGKYRLPRKPR